MIQAIEHVLKELILSLTFVALMDVPGLTAEGIAQKAMNIAADICIYTNKNFLLETLDTTPTL